MTRAARWPIAREVGRPSARPGRAVGRVRSVYAAGADAMVTTGGPDGPVGPGRTAGTRTLATVNAIKIRTAGLPVERGEVLTVVTRPGAVAAGRSGILFEQAYRAHVRHLACAIDQPGGG